MTIRQAISRTIINWDQAEGPGPKLTTPRLPAIESLVSPQLGLPNSQRMRRREINPKPKTLATEVSDETDYVKVDGRFHPGTVCLGANSLPEFSIYKHTIFYPGTMIGSANKDGEIMSMVTAGILVEKDGERHQFGNDNAEAIKIFQVLQGNPGSQVGFVRERIGTTDIALAQSHDGITFENKFVHSDNCRIGELFVFDSFAVGVQYVSCFGKGFTTDWVEGTPHPFLREAEGVNNNVKYTAVEQGAFATNAPKITGTPKIRDSVCGSVLIRCEDATTRSVKIKRPDYSIQLPKGEVGGMLHPSNLQFRLSGAVDDYILFADSFDPLVEAGWSIVRENGEEDGDGDNSKHKNEEAADEGSPQKRRSARLRARYC